MNMSKTKPKENTEILRIIMKYSLYEEISVKPVFLFAKRTPYGLPIPGLFEEFTVNARVSEEDYNMIQLGDYCSRIIIKELELPFKCYIASAWSDLKNSIYHITLYFACK